MRAWLRSGLREGSWALADRVIGHAAAERASQWRGAANVPVLVGLLRSPGSQEHLDWIRTERLYYQPLTKSQERQYYARKLAIYTRRTGSVPGAVRHVAEVTQIEVRPRHEIATPWPPRRDGDALMLVYRLDRLVPLEPPIESPADDDSTMRSWRWTSELGLRRARTVSELLLESEPEWRWLARGPALSRRQLIAVFLRRKWIEAHVGVSP